jgi:hypothetical protein
MLQHQHAESGTTPPPVSAAPRRASGDLATTMLDVQRSAGNAAAGAFAQALLARSLKVSSPKGKITKHKTSKLKQTNAATANGYLDRLCPEGNVQVDAKTGVVTVDGTVCGGKSKTPTGCDCLCHMIGSANKWKIEITDTGWPYTKFDSHSKAEDPNRGSGGTVTAPSPNDPREFGTATVSGALLKTDPWLVLGHELCGHAWMGDQGLHGPDEAQPRGEGGHQATVKRENLIRAEQGIELRGSFNDPNCGESYVTKKGTTTWSTFHKVCVAWRAAHGYDITDRLADKDD